VSTSTESTDAGAAGQTDAECKTTVQQWGRTKQRAVVRADSIDVYWLAAFEYPQSYLQERTRELADGSSWLQTLAETLESGLTNESTGEMTARLTVMMTAQ
jgi:hypothetical protein